MTTKMTSVCLAAATILTSFFSVGMVSARTREIVVPVPAEQLDEATKLTLARALVGEADWHTPDHIAIAWVLSRRWRSIENKKPGSVTFADYIAKYAAPLKTKSERTIWVQSLPWGDLPATAKNAQYQRHWTRVRALVEAWSQGRVADPCPSAWHYGGAMDRAGEGQRPVSCGFTRNIFYGFKPRT